MIGVAFGHSVEQSVGRAADGATPFICVRVMGRRSGRRTGASHGSSRFTQRLIRHDSSHPNTVDVSIRGGVETRRRFSSESMSKRLSTRVVGSKCRPRGISLKWQTLALYPFSLYSLLLGSSFLGLFLVESQVFGWLRYKYKLGFFFLKIGFGDNNEKRVRFNKDP